MTQQPIRIVQLSDLHVYGEPEKVLLGVNTRESFSALLKLLQSDQRRPDLLLLSGDISQDGSDVSYQYVADLLQPFSIPTYYIPGNHDDADVMNKVYPYGILNEKKHILFDAWQIILLDSHIPKKVPGKLEKSEIDFLESCLANYPNQRAIVVFHHHPVPVGCVWLDNLGLQNADVLWGTLKKYPNVHTILFGHVHQQCEGKKNNINYYSVPSTCIQFKKNVIKFALDKIPPSYRWIELFNNGEMKTGVSQLDHYVGHFDEKATGY